MELYSGKDPLFSPAEMMQAERNLNNINFCEEWLCNFQCTGGQIEVSDGRRWDQLPEENIKQLCSQLMSTYIAQAIGQLGGLH